MCLHPSTLRARCLNQRVYPGLEACFVPCAWNVLVGAGMQKKHLKARFWRDFVKAPPKKTHSVSFSWWWVAMYLGHQKNRRIVSGQDMAFSGTLRGACDSNNRDARPSLLKVC